MLYLRSISRIAGLGLLISLLTLVPVLSQQPVPEGIANLYDGEDFSIVLPTHATVEMTETGDISILGPEISIRPVDMDFTVSGPAYALTISRFENPESLSSEAWATENILAAWQEARDNNEITGTLPVSDEGQLIESDVERLTLAGSEAFRVQFFGGDSMIIRIYVAHGNQALVFSYNENIVENNPLALLQTDIYAMLLSSLTLISG